MVTETQSGEKKLKKIIISCQKKQEVFSFSDSIPCFWRDYFFTNCTSDIDIHLKAKAVRDKMLSVLYCFSQKDFPCD